MSPFLKRVLGATLGITSLVLLAVFWGKIGLIIIAFIFASWTTFEIQRFIFDHLCKSAPISLRVLFSLSTLALFTLHGFSFESTILTPIVVTFYYCMTMLLMNRDGGAPTLLKFISLSSMGFLYGAILPASALKILNFSSDGPHLFFLLLTMVFIGDTMAYILGSQWGKKKIAPKLSPNKTVLGALGGLIGTTIVSVGFGLIFPMNQPWFLWFFLGIFVAITAQMGDIFESLVKRAVNVKDSGKYFIGHGGALDRLDGLFFSAPVFYFFVHLFLS